MKNTGILGASVLAAAIVFPIRADARTFILTAVGLPAGQPIAKTFVYSGDGCSGKNRSPALSWSGAPKGTKSFVVTMHDPDARGGWWHWAVANIPASVHQLARGAGDAGSHALPASAVQLTNDFGDAAYDGPCPPPGDAPHHYHFRVYALDVGKLPLKASDSPARLKSLLRQHSLGIAQAVRRYGR